MPSKEGIGMAGSGTPPGRAATTVAAAAAAAGAATEAAMAPAIAAAMAEGAAVAVAAGIERSSHFATGFCATYVRSFYFFYISLHIFTQ
jgi:hypothetical protein